MRLSHHMKNRRILVENIIKKIIKNEGPITFARFMELVLYHPEEGYYTSHKKIIGKEGDFYTSVHVSSIFGETIAEQVAEMAEILGTDEFKIVEYGAGRGYLALDIIKTLQKDFPQVFARTTYYIIEVGPGLKEKQEKLLSDLNLPVGKIQWVESLAQIEKPLIGCVLSNELVDAFPVHAVQAKGGQLQEIFVGLDGDEFIEILKSPSTPLITQYFHRQGITLLEDQRGEVNLAALRWIQEVGEVLEQGFVLTIDYGYEAQLLYHSARKDGTVMCYKEHRATPNPYENVGCQDITAHVNFTALNLWGADVGLETTGFTNQMHFLFNLGIGEKAKDDMKKTRAVQHLVHPDGMGGIFKVLIQHKGVENPRIKGFIDIFKR